MDARKKLSCSLCGVERPDAGGEFRPVRLPYTAPFFWAPSNHMAESIPVKAGRLETCDFGSLGRDGFRPGITNNPVGSESQLSVKGRIRYRVAIVADNYANQREFLFTVTWNGDFDERPELTEKYLTIEPCPSPSAGV